MPLLDYLLSGLSPISENFIQNVKNQTITRWQIIYDKNGNVTTIELGEYNLNIFKFINAKIKGSNFYNLGIDGILMFYPKNKKTNNSNTIYNVSNNEMPTKIKNHFSIKVKNSIKIIWNISMVNAFEQNTNCNPILLLSEYKPNKLILTNLEVLEYIYKSYFENIHKYIVKQQNHSHYKKISYKMDGIKVITINNCTHIYPNFSEEYCN